MKLVEYLEKKKISKAQFAQMLGVNDSFIYKICAGTRRPGVELAREIIKLTKGKIKLDELLPPREKKKVLSDDSNEL